MEIPEKGIKPFHNLPSKEQEAWDEMPSWARERLEAAGVTISASDELRGHEVGSWLVDGTPFGVGYWHDED